ncbi:DNA primase [candidate division WOR-3 bacterium]|nr:DNA primase [candidate division WOR-3 bacterium]
MSEARLEKNAKVEEVLEKTPIVELVSEYVKLVPSGKDFKGLCPFHSEKTPSFTVSPLKNLYYCFGCGAGGNAFNFLMQMENIDFKEALKKLAKRAGVSLDDGKKTDRGIYEVMEFACVHYQECLMSPAGVSVRKYLGKRGLTENLISLFRIGFSKGALASEAKKSGFSFKILEKAGLVSKKNSSFYETFTGRLIFPISDSSGKVIAFGGRDLNGKGAKYLNSRQMEIYDKSSTLYGIHLAKKAASKSSKFMLVEGYMDVISLFKGGFENAVASCGTSLTSEQAKSMKRYADSVDIFYDSDESGKRAAGRAIEIILSAGLDCEVIVTEKYKDPDELVNRSKDPGKEIENNIKTWLDFIMDVHYSAKPADKSKLASKIIGFLNRIQDRILRDEWKRKASTSLGIPDIDDYLSKNQQNSEEKALYLGSTTKEKLFLLLLSSSKRDDSAGEVAKSGLNDYLIKYGLKIAEIENMAEEIERSDDGSSLRKEFLRLRFCEESEAIKSIDSLMKKIGSQSIKEECEELIKEIKIAQQKGESTRELALKLQQLVREGRK